MATTRSTHALPETYTSRARVVHINRTHLHKPSGKTETVSLADDGITADTIANNNCDLACRLSLFPQGIELINFFIRPYHYAQFPKSCANLADGQTAIFANVSI